MRDDSDDWWIQADLAHLISQFILEIPARKNKCGFSLDKSLDI